MKKIIILAILILGVVFAFWESLNKQTINDKNENINIVSLDVNDIGVESDVETEAEFIRSNSTLMKPVDDNSIIETDSESADSKVYEKKPKELFEKKLLGTHIQLKQNFKEFENNERDGEWSLYIENEISKILNEYKNFALLDEALVLLECHKKFCVILFDKNLLEKNRISDGYIFNDMPKNVVARVPELFHYHSRLGLPEKGMVLVMFKINQ